MSDDERVAPHGLFDRAAMTQRKRARQAALAEALSGAPLPTLTADVDVDAFVDEIAGRVVERIAARTNVAPVDARPTSSFDGGARQALPSPPPTHEQWLVEVIRSRRANVGANF